MHIVPPDARCDGCLRAAGPARRGLVRVPGDKSISHRYALFAALADRAGRVIHGYAPGADCASTLACLSALGVTIDGCRRRPATTDRSVTIDRPRPARPACAGRPSLDAATPATTIRLLSGRPRRPSVLPPRSTATRRCAPADAPHHRAADADGRADQRRRRSRRRSPLRAARCTASTSRPPCRAPR